jgi:hypothetical protein
MTFTCLDNFIIYIYYHQITRLLMQFRFWVNLILIFLQLLNAFMYNNRLCNKVYECLFCHEFY